MRVARKQALDKYNHSSKGLATRTKYNHSPKGKKSLCKARRNYSRTQKWQLKCNKQTLRKALQTFTVIGKREGWPDALNIEQKVGLDFIGVSQWRRSASLRAPFEVPIYLFFSETHESAVKGIGRKISFENYAKEIGLEKQWDRLVAKERK